MLHLKQKIKFILFIIIKIINWLGLLILLLFATIFYFIIFQVPFNYFNKYIEKNIFDNNIKIKNIYLKWDYSIKKPVIVFNDISYFNPNKNIVLSFNYLGVSFNISKLLFDQKFYPIYISLQGLDLSIMRNKDDTLSFNLYNSKNQEINDLLNNIDTSDTNNLNNNRANKSLKHKFVSETVASDILKKGFMNVFLEYRNKYKFLSLLNLIEIDNSRINFQDNKKLQNFNINLDKLQFYYNKIANNIIAKSNFSITSDVFKSNSMFSGTLTLDKNNNIFFNYYINNIDLNLLFLYSDNDYLNKFHSYGLNNLFTVYGEYNINKGIKKLQSYINFYNGSIENTNLFKKRLYINSINAEASYNKDNNSIFLSKFNILFDNDEIGIKSINSNIYIKSIMLDTTIDLKNNYFDVNNIKINSVGSIFNANLNYKNHNTQFNLSSSDDIDIKKIMLLWPSSVAQVARSWFISNVYKGTVKSIKITGDFYTKENKISLNNISGKALINQVRLRYLDKMPFFDASIVNLSFNKEGLYLQYVDGKTGKIFSKTGEVDLVNETPSKKEFNSLLKFQSIAHSNIEDVLFFINQQPLELLKDTKLDFSRFKGEIAGKINFNYSFKDKKIKDFNSDLTTNSLFFKDAFKNYDVSNGNMNVKINMDNLSAYGTVNYLNMKASLFLDLSFNKDNPYLFKITAESNNVQFNNISKLDLLPEFLDKSMFGEFNLSTQLQYMKNDKQLIKVNLDLKNSNINNIKFLNYNKKVGEPLKASLSINVNNNKIETINPLILSGQNLSAQLQIDMNKNNKIILLNRLFMDKKIDVKGYLYLSNTDFNANIKGNMLDFGWLLDNINQLKNNSNNINLNDFDIANNDFVEKDMNKISINNSDNNESTPFKNYQIKLDIKHTFNKNTTINNLYLDLGLYNNILNKVLITGDFRNNKNLTIIFDKNNHKIILNVDTLGDMLEFLNLTNKIQNGQLYGTINYMQDKNKDVITSGALFLQNFYLNGISFFSSSIDFVGNNYNYNINNIILKGGILGGELKGTYNAKNNYIYLSGYIVPIWSASHLIINIPIIGDILRGFKDQGNRGLLNIPLKLYGNTNNIKYEFTK